MPNNYRVLRRSGSAIYWSKHRLCLEQKLGLGTDQYTCWDPPPHINYLINSIKIKNYGRNGWAIYWSKHWLETKIEPRYGSIYLPETPPYIHYLINSVESRITIRTGENYIRTMIFNSYGIRSFKMFSYYFDVKYHALPMYRYSNN